MTVAYVLIKTSPGHEREVFYKLRNVTGISEAHPVIGRYNIIAKIKAEDYENLGYIVVDKINHLEHISSTEVLATTLF